MLLEGIFWGAIAVNAITFVGYPVFIMAAAYFVPSRKGHYKDMPSPTVSVIICAHNEIAAISQKIISVLQSDYSHQFEVLVGDDGSTDGTADAVRAIQDSRVRLFEFPRSGKAAVLDALVAKAAFDTFVFSDADPIWRRDTLANIVKPMANVEVGAVAGAILTQKSQRRLEGGDKAFRRYESVIRQAENRLFGAVSGDGGLYAIRRKYYEAPLAGATDDFFISTGAVAGGARIEFAPDAIALEESIASPRKHLNRRIRITVRGLASVFARRRLLNPFQYGSYAVGLFFHKVMRRLAPALMIPAALALSGLALVSGPYRILGATAVLGLSVSLMVILSDLRVLRLLRLPGYVIMHAWGLAVGCILFVAGVRYTQWTPAKEKAAQP